MTDWHVGMKIVCVKDTWLTDCWMFVPNKPVMNGIYTIREVVPNWWYKEVDLAIWPETFGIRLVEVVNKNIYWNHDSKTIFAEACFGVERFRPLITKKTETDIAVFKKLLTPISLTEYKKRKKRVDA